MFDRLDACHHFVGNLVTTLGPGINNLVVFFTLGDQAVIVLLLIFLGQRLGLVLQVQPLVSGITMSSLPNEIPARHAWPEAKLHDLVTENHSVFLA